MSAQEGLPAPGLPMVFRVITSPLFPEPGSEAPVTWVFGQAHPLVSGMTVVRMFVRRAGAGCVEIYSLSADRTTGVRNIIPLSWVRLIEEAMPLPVFIEELEASELGDDEDEDDEFDDEDESDNGGVALNSPSPSPQPSTPSNGQTVA